MLYVAERAARKRGTRIIWVALTKSYLEYARCGAEVVDG